MKEQENQQRVENFSAQEWLCNSHITAPHLLPLVRCPNSRPHFFFATSHLACLCNETFDPAKAINIHYAERCRNRSISPLRLTTRNPPIIRPCSLSPNNAPTLTHTCLPSDTFEWPIHRKQCPTDEYDHRDQQITFPCPTHPALQTPFIWECKMKHVKAPNTHMPELSRI